MVSHEQGIHFAHEIKRNSERLLSLINDIIRLSELDHSEMPRQYDNLICMSLSRTVQNLFRLMHRNREYIFHTEVLHV